MNKYGKNTSNAAESMNSAIKQFITKDVVNLIISLNNYTMGIISTRREEQRGFEIFQAQLNGLELNINISRSLTVAVSSINSYLVENSFTVDFLEKNCSCNKSFEFGFPCRHLCAVILYLRQDPLVFVESYFTLSNHRHAYSGEIPALVARGLSRDNLQPPEARRPRGRPRISRYRSATEN